MTHTVCDEMVPGVRFTRKEEQLLETLASHANEVVSRQFLLRNVWNYSDEAQTRTIDVHIQRLRTKLASRSDLRIVTIFGEGYVLMNGNGHGHQLRYAAVGD